MAADELGSDIASQMNGLVGGHAAYDTRVRAWLVYRSSGIP